MCICVVFNLLEILLSYTLKGLIIMYAWNSDTLEMIHLVGIGSRGGMSGYVCLEFRDR